MLYSVGVEPDSEGLRRDIDDLKQRLARLEAALTDPSAAAGRELTGGSRIPRAPQNYLRNPKNGKPAHTLETRIGAQLFNRVGIIAVLIGVAWFLKIAFDNRWLGSVGKISAGIAGGLGLMAWSEWFHHHGYDAFSYSQKAMGAGLLYLSLWASWSLFHLLPLPIAGAAMVVVTSAIGLLAWARNSELLAFYAAVGGFLTPALLSNGHNHETALFGYLLLLDTAALALSAVRPWPRLVLGAFLGTAVYGMGWYALHYTEAQFAQTVVLGAIFLLLFTASAWTAHKANRGSGILIATAVLNAVYGLLALACLFGPGRRGWAALAVCGFYYAIARPRGLPALHILIANGYLLAAVSFGIHGFWLGMAGNGVPEQISYSAWFMLFGTAVLAAGFWRRSAALRWQGLLALCLSIGKVFLVDLRTLSTGYRVLSFLGLGALLLAVSFVYQKDWLSLRSGR